MINPLLPIYRKCQFNIFQNISYWWFNAWLWYLQCTSNRDTTASHKTIQYQVSPDLGYPTSSRSSGRNWNDFTLSKFSLGYTPVYTTPSYIWAPGNNPWRAILSLIWPISWDQNFKSSIPDLSYVMDQKTGMLFCLLQCSPLPCYLKVVHIPYKRMGCALLWDKKVVVWAYFGQLMCSLLHWLPPPHCFG